MAEVVREVLDERLAPLIDKVDQAARAVGADGASPVEMVRARLRQRRAL